MKFLIEHAAALLAAEPGVGKTSTVFGAFKVLKKKGMARRMLVIAPLKPCYLVWPKEADKWRDFADLRIAVLHGPKKDAALASDAEVCVINPEGLDWLLGATKVKSASGRTAVTVDTRRFRALGFDTLVVDELTRFKSTSSVRFKTIKAVLGTFARRWGLTGTPRPNGLIDLFGQCYVLDMGRTFGPYVTHFRSEYFVPSADGFSWNLQRGAEARIYERIAPLALTLEARDYVDMPEVVENVLRFDLPPEARRVYDALEDDLLARLDGRLVTAANSGAASTKCRQVASGGVYLDADVLAVLGPGRKTEREWANLHEEKVDLVELLVEELQGSPLLVAYDFAHDLDRLRKRFGKDVPFIGGGTTPKRATELERAWNRGELPLLLGHPQSVAHGLNLQEGPARHVCWHSLTWDWEMYDQFIRRVRRQGSAHASVFVHHLIARGTIDEEIFWALRAKEKGNAAFFAALRALGKKRVR
jgi:SNF2 family DNA or RNA helicase